MSYSRRQLEAFGEPFGNSATQKKLGGGYIAGFGGDSQPSSPSQPSSVSQTTSNIPDWAIPYATRNLGKAEALTDINQNPYQTFQGNRVADFNPLQNQAFSNVAGMQTNTGTGNAMNQTQDAYNRSANAGPYNAQNFGNQYGSGPQFQNMGLGYLSANAQNFGQQSAQDYMSPYQQNVTDFQKQEAVKDYSRQVPGMNAQASGAGAFGGTRQALVAAEGQRNLQNQLSGIQAIGSQNAYQNAQQQFNADQARQMQAQLANQGAYGQMQGLGMQQNLSANQQAMQNAAQRAQYGLAGQQAGEASRQFGANYGLQNRQQALAAAGQLGTLGQQQYAQQLGINQAQQQAGAQIQAQEQQGLSNRYQDFLNQQNYPYKQLGFLSDIMRGTPTSGGAQSMYQAPPSGVSQFAGLAGGLGSLFGAYNTANRGAAGGAAGGDVRGYAEGGIVGLADGGEIAPLPNAAELMTAKNINAGKSTLDQELGMGADLRRLLMASMQLKELQKREDILKLQAQIQGAIGGSTQQDTTVAADVSNMLRQEVESSAAENAPERQGGIAELDTGNLGENYAGGGIVAFGNPEQNPSESQLVRSSRPGYVVDPVTGQDRPLTIAELNRDPNPETGDRVEAKQREKDRASMIDTVQNLAAAGLDIATLPHRGIAGAFESAVTRPLRALGVPLPYLPRSFYGGDASSMTPYYDRLEKLRSGEGLMDNAPTTAAPATAAPATAAPAAAAPPNPNVGIRTPSPAAPAAGSGEPVSTPAMDAARRSIVEMQRRSLQGLSDLDNPEVDPATGEPVPKKTLASIAAEQKTARTEALKAAGLPEQGYKERITELTGQASQARQDRDVDRWMAAAQGFFAMGAGGSRFAMQNMAEGLGVGTKQLQAAEKEYRVGEKARLDSIGALKQAQRAEVLGNQKEAVNSFEKYQEFQQKERDAQRKTFEHLGVVAAQQEGTLATKEAALLQAKMLKEAGMAQTAAIRAGTQEQAAARLAESERAHKATEVNRRDNLLRLNMKEHRLAPSLQTLYGQLANLETQYGEKPNPDLALKINALRTQTTDMYKQISSDAASKISTDDNAVLSKPDASGVRKYQP